jgi:hypothetical protein
MAACSRNSYRFGQSRRRGRDRGSEIAIIEPINAAIRRLTLRRGADTATAVPKSTSCSVIKTSVDDASTRGAAERGRDVDASGASAVLTGADGEMVMSFLFFPGRSR